MSTRIKEKGLGQAKKELRRSNKEGLNPFYIMVQREPLEKGLKAYTKLVSLEKAAVLIYGRPSLMGTPTILTRTFKVVE